MDDGDDQVIRREPDIGGRDGLRRRAVGGLLVWAAPMIQSLGQDDGYGRLVRTREARPSYICSWRLR